MDVPREKGQVEVSCFCQSFSDFPLNIAFNQMLRNQLFARKKAPLIYIPSVTFVVVVKMGAGEIAYYSWWNPLDLEASECIGSFFLRILIFGKLSLKSKQFEFVERSKFAPMLLGFHFQGTLY